MSAIADAALPRTLAEAVRTFVAHGSPRILLALVLASVGTRLVLGPPSASDALAVAILLIAWPIQEWLIHVFILHYRPIRAFGREWDFAIPRKHRAHHRDPWRLDLVFIPTQAFRFAPFLLGGLAWLLTPDVTTAATVVAAYFLLALHYEWVHFLVHTRYVPKSARYRRLWRNHRLHHCKSEHYWYGVTMLSGDRLLRTQPEHRAVALSPTCRTLGFAEDLGVGREVSAGSSL